MRIIGKYTYGPALLALTLLAGAPAPAQDVEVSRGVEVGKAPVVLAATIVCGPLEKKYTFDPETYGTVRGDAPIRASHAPLVLYTSALTPGFFKLASAVDALIAKDKTWANSMVIVMDEKGAQYGGYKIEELTQRRTSLRQLVLHNSITHLSFFISAAPAKALMTRLSLTGKQDLLLATLENRTKPRLDSPVLSAQRLESETLTDAACKKIVATLVLH